MGIKLSACTIAKNEGLNIGKSIDSYKDYVDEIIIVDTGSIDDTVEIAKSKGAKVLKFDWINDFSAAKNFALDNATGDWIIFLDADEWFDKDCAKNIRDTIDNSVNSNYDSVACKIVNFYTETEIIETAATIRIFKHADNIRFNRAIHETLFDLNTNKALPGLYNENLVINHSGYMKDVADKKTKRNKELLDKYFAKGDFLPIDYFYGIRENLTEDLDISDYFYKLVNNTPNYEELISSFNISNSLDEVKLKLVNNLNKRYSFDCRAKLLEEIQKRNIDNPMFKFEEYILFQDVDFSRAIKALKDAIELDKNYSKDNVVANNAFCKSRGIANTILGEYYIFINDRLKALECFTEAIKHDYKNIDAFKGLLYTISNEKVEDVILFINSLYKIEDKEVEKFIVDSLIHTEFKDVFLYYFVDYCKKYEEVDSAFFTSRLYTGNFEEIADKYIKVYKESKDDRALIYIVSALICGNCKEKFLENLDVISGSYFNILNSYFENEKITEINDFEFNVINKVIYEIRYIASEDVLMKLFNLSEKVKVRFQLKFIRDLYNDYSYNIVLKWIEKFNEEKNDKNFEAYFNYLQLRIWFSNSNFDKIPEFLDKVISSGMLRPEIIYICDALEAEDDKLTEYFDMFDKLNFAKQNLGMEKIEDKENESVKFMTIDKFNEEVSNKKIQLLDEHLITFSQFARYLKEKKAYNLAEEYYRILIKYGFELDKSYYELGEIYNYLDKPELSYYCYEKAFLENLTLAKKFIPLDQPNNSYIFTKKEENHIDICPICGAKAKHIKTYTNLFDKDLNYNEPLIVKYACCSECGHIFAMNDIANKKYWNENFNEEVNFNKIGKYYDILEDICEMTEGNSILDCSRGNEFKTCATNYNFEVSKEISGNKFDVIFADEILTKTYDIEKVLNLCIENLAQNGIIIFEIFDKDNAFSKLALRPYWAKVKVKNIFSRKSMEILFEKFNLQILQTTIDKTEKGKIIVIASK